MDFSIAAPNPVPSSREDGSCDPRRRSLQWDGHFGLVNPVGILAFPLSTPGMVGPDVSVFLEYHLIVLDPQSRTSGLDCSGLVLEALENGCIHNNFAPLVVSVADLVAVPNDRHVALLCIAFLSSDQGKENQNVQFPSPGDFSFAHIRGRRFPQYGYREHSEQLCDE